MVLAVQPTGGVFINGARHCKGVDDIAYLVGVGLEWRDRDFALTVKPLDGLAFEEGIKITSEVGVRINSPVLSTVESVIVTRVLTENRSSCKVMAFFKPSISDVKRGG